METNLYSNSTTMEQQESFVNPVMKELGTISWSQISELPPMHTLIQIPDIQINHFMPLLSTLPEIANGILSKTGKTYYKITLPDTDVMVSPKDLMSKGNGAHTSNLVRPGSSHFGPQADIKPVTTMNMNDINTVINVAHTIVSQMTVAYYAKKAEENLQLIIERNEMILSFLDKDKQSEVISDMTEIQEIISNISSITSNATLCQADLNVVMQIKRSARKNLIFYRDELNTAIKEIMKKIQEGEQWEKETFESILGFYRICAEIYALCRLLEVLLSNCRDSEYIKEIKKDLDDVKTGFSQFYDLIRKEKDNIENKREERAKEICKTKSCTKYGLYASLFQNLVMVDPITGVPALIYTLSSNAKRKEALEIEQEANEKIKNYNNISEPLIGLTERDPIQQSYVALEQYEKSWGMPLQLYVDNEKVYMQKIE